MSPTPPSTTSSSAGGQSPDAQYRVVRKRNRVPLSCGPCRHRKLKCNRTHPCDNCVRRGDASSCSYAAPGTRKKNQSQGSSSPDDMQNRIDRLEGLVLSLMTNGAQSAGPAAAVAAISRSTSTGGPSPGQPRELDQEDNDMIKEEDEEGSDVDDVSNSFGALKVDNEKGKSMYFGESHWHLVLADIAEVKNYFASHKRELEQQYNKVANANPSTALGGPIFLFGAHAPVTESELRAALPPKSAVEKLVSRYFNSLDPAVYTLHYPTFHKQLKQHFQDPANTCIVWLGLLYSIICLAMQSYHKIGDEPPEWKGRTLQLAGEYRLRTVQCLVISDYTKSVDNTIETLLLYIHGEYSLSWDTEVGIWVVIGMIVRLAMRMGYHRDPKCFPMITPFKGEMRRRVWSFVRGADILFSFQLALPSMIRGGDCDAELPRNIFDDEFGPDSKELPPARPITEPTPLSYTLTKSQLAFVFGEIIEHINSLSGRTATYDEVMRYDNKLRQVQANMAPHMKLRPLEACTHDPASLLMQRFHIDILYQKAMCVLHRKYLTRARQNPRYAHSRRSCVEASMEILRHQATLHREAQIGGRLRTMKWVISSLTKHDFLLGAMIVCLDLHYDSNAEQYDAYFWTTEQRNDMVRALETTHDIWKESADASVEAYKASNIIAVMLEKLKRQGRPPPPTSVEPRTTSEVFASFDENLQPEHSAAMTLGMLSTGGLTPNTASLFNNAMPLSPGGTKYSNIDMTMGDAAASTGLTPNFAMDGTNSLGALNGGASPFSQVFGNMGSGSGMMEMPTNLDWEAWDSYIQSGNSLDPSLQFYPTGFDPLTPNADMQADQNAFGNSVFMGANTPGRN